MTESIRVTHELPFSTERFLELFFDPGLVAFLGERLDFRIYALDELGETEEGLMRRLRVVPDFDLPGIAARFLKTRQVEYLETTTHSPGTNELNWSVEVNVLTDRIDIAGATLLEDIGPDRCRRSVDGEVDVSLAGIGSHIEEQIAESTAAGLAEGCQLMIAYHELKRGN